MLFASMTKKKTKEEPEVHNEHEQIKVENIAVVTVSADLNVPKCPNCNNPLVFLKKATLAKEYKCSTCGRFLSKD